MHRQPPNDALIVFIRLPVLGHVKTRVASTAGDTKALAVYHQLVTITLDAAAASNVNVFLFYSGGLPEKSDRLPGFTYLEQSNGGLGEKIEHALATVLAKHEKVVIIGSDCPELSASTIQNSFYALDTFDIVVGPATDGGFYLLGCTKRHPFLFNQIQWSSTTVLSQLLTNAREQSLSYELLNSLSDIDTEKDWMEFEKRRN